MSSQSMPELLSALAAQAVEIQRLHDLAYVSDVRQFEHAGAQKTVVLTAQFQADAGKDPPTVTIRDDNSVQILAIAPGDGGSVVVGFDPVKFVLNYLVNIRHWIGELA